MKTILGSTVTMWPTREQAEAIAAANREGEEGPNVWSYEVRQIGGGRYMVVGFIVVISDESGVEVGTL